MDAWLMTLLIFISIVSLFTWIPYLLGILLEKLIVLFDDKFTYYGNWIHGGRYRNGLNALVILLIPTVFFIICYLISNVILLYKG